MSTLPTHSPRLDAVWTVADLQQHLGDIPAARIRIQPPPGLATEHDLIHIVAAEDRTWELIDGVLVEKTMGYYEARLAAVLVWFIQNFLTENDLGIVLGADAAVRILPNQVRVPDVSFVAWRQFPDRKLPAEPVPSLAPDLAVEMLAEGNTDREMQRKLDDYFSAGVRLVWYIDWRSRTAEVYSSRTAHREIGENEALDGGNILTGFALRLGELFARAGELKEPQGE